MSDFARAFALFQKGDLAGAERELLEVLRFYPGHGDAAHLLAGVLHAQGRTEPALAQFARAADIAPNDPTIAFNHAGVLAGAGRHEAAAVQYRRALSLRPDDVEALLALGLSLAALRRPEDALVRFDAARILAPRNPAAHYNAGVALAALDRHMEAIAAYDAALALQRDHLDARANRAIACAALLRFDEAIADAASVAAQAPNDAARQRDLALILLEADRPDEALELLDRALAIAPDDAHARYAKATTLLAAGDFENGWPLYEERWRVRGAPQARPYAAPRWIGGGDIAGKRVLVRGEQGIGDAFMFCRFAPLLAARGAEVIVQERAALLGVLESLTGVHALVANEALAPAHDVVTEMASLPLALGVTLETLPRAPYLAAEPARIAPWRARLGPGARRRIGIAWQGAGGDRRALRRALPLAALERLLAADADFISLQLDIGSAAPLFDATGARHFGEDIRDFRDLAGLIAALDLVVTIDTAVAHLAGAMGAPIWLLLHRPAEWRWLRAVADSPWYTRARLFRQNAFGDWDGVIDDVLAALQR